ncbi:phosphocarrier protein HPr [Streptomyces spiroverticillatus]|uniref:Phosphocarrier protein HPr n=1 Tax=Streptomyces finlayi TaxID=67296 RepID=A0A919CEB9_9ACTN|nr:HPr family phosphocarrier protein [Streptomyces finlayi]GHA40623.1 phosphocarrier protein HPr [Streptomyces spiroverticillatus]GHD15365.1 phosphocarrier protein HPr [Streptomyces finlayi]
MAEREVRVGARSGFHARPAAVFVRAAADSGHRGTLAGAERTADGRSVLAVLGLAAGPGERLRLTVTGDDEERTLERLARLIEADSD